MSTGPTGPIDPNLLTSILNGPLGLTGANEYIKLVAPYIVPSIEPPFVPPTVLAMFPNAESGPTESPHIATLDELMASHAATIAKEAADKAVLNILLSPTREAFRTQLFQWASAGFPDLYVIQTFSITPPEICTDGETREIGKYIEYCIGTDLGSVITTIKSLMTGIQPSWSITANSLRIHVTKAS